MAKITENLLRVVSLRGTKADVEALTANLEETVVAFATDTNEVGIYTNGAWVWMLALHLAAADPHTQYQKESEKAAVNGYAGLGAAGYVPTNQLGSGSASVSTVLRGDNSWGGSPVPAAEILTDDDGNILMDDDGNVLWGDG